MALALPSAAPATELSATTRRMLRMCGLDAALREEHAALLRDTLMLRDLLQHNQPFMVVRPRLCACVPR